MEPITGAIISGGLNILGGMAQNAAIKKAATKSYNTNNLWIQKDQAIQNENLQFAGDEVNRQLGAALTDLLYQANREQATLTAVQAEKNAYGNTALRQQAVAKIKEELSEDRLIQQGEAQMTDIQSKLSAVKNATDAAYAKNAMDYNNAMSQRKSTFEIIAGGIGAGISGYSTAQGIKSANNTLALQEAQLATMSIPTK